MKTLILVSMIFSASIFAQVYEKKVYKRPLREVSIIVTDDGFYPNKVVAFQGEKLHFFVTSTANAPQCFLLQNHEIFLSAEKGKVNEGDILVDKPGRYRFYCPSTKFEGHLTVIEKFKDEPKRDIASEKPKYWLPRDYD